MGKHKNRGRKKNRQQHHGRENNKKKDDPNDNDDASSSSSSNMLLKIRHADPHTRLAALTALKQHASSAVAPNNMALWQAVREQVMDSQHLPVATLAASCLQEFVLVSAAQTSDNLSSSNNHDLTTAGWYLILLGRAQEAHQRVTVLSSSSSTATTTATNNDNDSAKASSKPQKQQQLQQQQWLELALACLSTMTCLVQENPVVTERLERTAALRRDSFRVIWQWLSYAAVSGQEERADAAADAVKDDPMETAAASSAASTIPTTSLQLQQQQLQEQVASLWQLLAEEDVVILQPWYHEETEEATSTLQGLWNMMQNERAESSSTKQLSSLAHLHLTGVLLASFGAQLPMGDEESKQHQPQSDNSPRRHLLHTVLSHLELPPPSMEKKNNDNDDPFTSNNERSTLWQAYQAAQQQELDSTLEKNVVKQQTVKKEPARAIARRLNQQQRQQQTTQAASANDPPSSSTAAQDGAKMAVDNRPNKKGALPAQRTDYCSEYQTLLDDWRQRHVALELALEMTANLTSRLLPNPDEDEDEAMQVEDDNDEEPRSLLDTEIHHVLVGEGQKPLQRLLNQITVETILAMEQHSTMDKAEEGGEEDTVMKNNNASESDDDAAASLLLLWRDLVRAVPQKHSLAGTMVVLLQQHPDLASTAALDMDVFLNLMEDQEREADPEACRDLISLVGLIVCQQEHARDVNYRVCQSLVRAGTESSSSSSPPPLVVLAESLNVLMDIYGDDHRHPQVFEELGVLQHFQTSLPVLKQQLNLLSQQQQHGTVADNAEYLKEIALNASRFIQYKKNHGS